MSYELIYASWARPQLDQQFVLQMVKEARLRNQHLGLTGLLLFDSERFLQLLEGELEAVGEVTASIERDRRHHDYTPLHAGAQFAGRRFPEWRMGFAVYEPGVLSHAINRLHGAQLADYLQQTPLSRIDIG